MRRKPIAAVVLCLAFILPASVLGAPPSGTTQISGASAFFSTQPAGEDCATDHLIVTLAQDAYRAVGGATRPLLSGWFDVQVWHESGCDAPEMSGSVQQTVYGLEAGSYRIIDLTAAYVAMTFAIRDESEAIIRTFDVDIAWVADGTIARTTDRNPGLKVTGWDTGAHFTGSLLDSAGLITMDDLDFASIGIGNYILYPAPDQP